MLLYENKEIRDGRCITLDDAKGLIETYKGYEITQLTPKSPFYIEKGKDLVKEVYSLSEAKKEIDKLVGATKDATNHMGERSFQTYEAWKKACKAINPNVQFEGGKDICQAKPGIGEWDGAEGIIYTKDAAPGNMVLAHKYRIDLKEGVGKIIVFAGDDGGVFYKYKLPGRFDTFRARWDEIESVESLTG